MLHSIYGGIYKGFVLKHIRANLRNPPLQENARIRSAG